MRDEAFAHRLKVAIDVAPMDPALQSRVLSSLPMIRPERPDSKLTWMSAIAAVLVVSIIAALVYAGWLRQNQQPQSHPAGITDCVLPVAGFGASTDDRKIGFFDLSDGTFTPAPPDTMTELAKYSWLLNASGRAPTYDRVLNQWLPVPAAWVAPDGLAFAYIGGDTFQEIHLRNLQTQSDVVLVPSTPHVRLVGWNSHGIYYTPISPGMGSLWVVDPVQGQAHDVGPAGEWWIVTEDAVWGSPWYSGGSIPRYDVATGTTTYWAVDRPLELIAVDSAGHPIVLQLPVGSDRAGAGAGSPVLLLASGKAVSLGAKGDELPVVIYAVTDGDRVWLWSYQTLWLYTRDTGLLRLDQASNSAMPAGPVIGGRCL